MRVAPRVWKVIALAAVSAAAVILVHIALIYPQFTRRLVRDAEEEAVRTGRHVGETVRRLMPGPALGATPAARAALADLTGEFGLWKLRVFAPDGTIVWSSAPGEEGRVNDREYFRTRVTRGEVVSKAVWNREGTLDGVAAPRDVVETYVPFMEGGAFLGACELYYDVTGRKAALDRLALQSTLLTTLVAVLLVAVIAASALRAERDLRERERLQEQLLRADRLAGLGTLVSGMSHEFNNANAAVMGFSQFLLERGGLDAESRACCERILGAARRARTVAENLLSFSRLRPSRLARAPLDRIAADTLGLVRGLYEKEGIRFETRLDPVPESLVDADQMGQVFLNLLTNARHATLGRDPRVIRLATGTDDHHAWARVEDTGCGIPAGSLSQIFTPFYSTKGEHGGAGPQATVRGTGLGLSICHTIVRNHRGEIAVESTEGEGARFTIRVPLAPPGTEGDAG